MIGSIAFDHLRRRFHLQGLVLADGEVTPTSPRAMVKRAVAPSESSEFSGPLRLQFSGT